FPQLLTLKWMNHFTGYCSSHYPFPSLTEISFDGKGEPLGVNYFCELLLRYPRTCPRLERLCMHRYPEWDMLLYMLLRRNIYYSCDNISQIACIEIPGYPGPCILAPLSTLLLGKIPFEMPSLEELSFVAVAEISFNPAISGCADCIGCRLTCSTPFVSSVPERFPIAIDWTLERAKTNIPQGSDPPLPVYLQDWVDRWRERWHTWAQKQSEWKEHGKRNGHCLRHNYSRLVVIDGHTLDG
ncbi:hypothetical protein CPB86DRAFT_679002, partial [Serendipita vermifera]